MIFDDDILKSAMAIGGGRASATTGAFTAGARAVSASDIRAIMEASSTFLTDDKGGRFIDPELLKPLDTTVADFAAEYMTKPIGDFAPEYPEYPTEPAGASSTAVTDPTGWKVTSMRWLSDNFPAFITGAPSTAAHHRLVTAMGRSHMLDSPSGRATKGETAKVINRVVRDWDSTWHGRMVDFMRGGCDADARGDWIHELWGSSERRTETAAREAAAVSAEKVSDAPTIKGVDALPLDQDLDAVVAHELGGSW